MAVPARAWGGSTCGTRACARCWTATRPTPGPTPAGRPPRWRRCPYVEQTFGAWYVRGGLRRLGLALHQRVLDRGAVGAHRSDVAEVRARRRRPGQRRAAGRRRAAAGRRRRVRCRRPARCTPISLRRRWPARAARGSPAATPSLSGLRPAAGAARRTPGLAHHTCSSRRTTTTSSTRSSARAGTGAPAAVPDPTVYVGAPDDPALRPDDDTSPGSCWSTPLGTSRTTRGRRRLGRSRPGRGVRRPGPRGDGRPRPRRPGAVAVARGSHSRRSERGDRQRRRLDLRQLAATAPGRPSCGRPTARRCPACSSSAARPTPAVASRWWGCRPPSWPTSWAHPDAAWLPCPAFRPPGVRGWRGRPP